MTEISGSDFSAVRIPRRQLVWERDGEETIRTRAHGWAGRLAYVELRDPRAEIRWVWLPAEDVHRVE